MEGIRFTEERNGGRVEACWTCLTGVEVGVNGWVMPAQSVWPLKDCTRGQYRLVRYNEHRNDNRTLPGVGTLDIKLVHILL
jgi:hypothetical protein